MSNEIWNGQPQYGPFYCPNTKSPTCEMCKLVHYLSIAEKAANLRSDQVVAKLCEESAESVKGLCHVVDKLTPHLARFDFDEVVQANGYRSFVWETQCAVTECLHLITEFNQESCRRSSSKKASTPFVEKLRDWSRIFRVLLVLVKCLVNVVESSPSDSLFSSSESSLTSLSSVSKDEALVAFHGRLLGFQFCRSMREALGFVANLMGAFSHVYKTESRIKGSLVISSSFLYYMMNPTARAERLRKVIHEGPNPLEFFRLFWLIPETGISKIFFSCIGEPLETNQEMKLPPTKLTTTTKSGTTLTILPPYEYSGQKPVDIRLISHKKIAGAVGSGDNDNDEDLNHNDNIDESSQKARGGTWSKTLILHCHGGGFVSQSSNTHLTYIRTWSKGINCPIVSVDYSLAPESPYPRALHEVFYAYIWCLQNAHLLGSSAQRIVFVGDSAGGQLLCGVILLCTELGLRIPDNLVLIYSPLLMETAISPARLLSLGDPLLQYAAFAACCKAYLGHTFDPTVAQVPGGFVEGDWEKDMCNLEECSRKFVVLKGLDAFEGVNSPKDDWHLSPLIAPDSLLAQFPPTAVISTVFDPCLDDCVEFAKRLKAVEVPTTLDVLPSLPHGFLNFGRVSEESSNGIEICYRRLKSAILT